MIGTMLWNGERVPVLELQMPQGETAGLFASITLQLPHGATTVPIALPAPLAGITDSTRFDPRSGQVIYTAEQIAEAVAQGMDWLRDCYGLEMQQAPAEPA